MIKNKFTCIIKCNFCKQFFEVGKWRGNKAKYCSQSCNKKNNPINHSIIKRNYGKDHFRWSKNGCKRKDGYILISVMGKRIYQHRYIMEKHLKRKLKTKEHIHHINGNKSDNRIENLQLISLSKHLILEHSIGTYKKHLNKLNNK